MPAGCNGIVTTAVLDLLHTWPILEDLCHAGRRRFGGHTIVNTYADFGMPADLPGADKIVFGLVAAENGFRVMGYDIPGETEGSIAGNGSTRRENNTTVTDQALFMSIGSDTFEELQTYWEALAADAVIIEPLAASTWSSGFGMLTDRFGVTWIISVTTA